MTPPDVDPMADLMGSHKRNQPKGEEGGTALAERTAVEPPASPSTPSPVESGQVKPAAPAKETRRPRTVRSSSRVKKSASTFPEDWAGCSTRVPAATLSRAWSQMRPSKIGLEAGEGKGPGKHYLIAIKATAADRILGDDLDTTGFLFGNEEAAIKATEDAILDAARKILEKRNS